MASFSPIEGFLARGAVEGTRARLVQGRYSFQIVRDGRVVESGRRHVLVSSSHLLLLDPNSSQLTGLPIDQIASLKITNAQLLHPALRLSTVAGEQLELVDTVTRSQGDEITAMLRGVVEAAEPLANLAQCSALVARARAEVEKSARRADAASRGELLSDDVRDALREDVLAQGQCLFLGSRTGSEDLVGPVFRGVAAAGATTFGFINPKRSTRACFQSAIYEDVAGAGYRREEDDDGSETWLVEFIIDSAVHTPLERPDECQLHVLVRLPAPSTFGPPNVTGVIVARARERSRIDLEGHIGPESSVPGLLLLPETASRNTVK